MEDTRNLKMLCIFSNEAIKAMGGNRGKLAAMSGHAFLHSWLNAMEKDLSKNTKDYNFDDLPTTKYLDGSAKKVVLVVETTEELVHIYNEYRDEMGATLVRDSAHTVFSEPTITCVGLGPIVEEECDDFLKSLKVLI